ncbi:MAG: dihydroorotate dehydrogenase [Marinilabiliaceae bacterium]|nr:dihydroorotate dehydrogenase [Marinilabiliaceae bacterium]
MVNMNINLGNGLRLANPVMTASGTFGYGYEYDDFTDVDKLGAFIVKGTTLNPREGNAYPRLAEVRQGMINAVGLQNKGVDYFCKNIYPKLSKYTHSQPIVNVSGSCIEDYVEAAKRIAELSGINAIELNISCPNVKHGGMSFGTIPEMAAKVVSEVRRAYPKHLMVKLTPNVTSIVDIAKAVSDAGADSVSLINTLLSMAINAETRRPLLSTITGGLSGACVKPIALRMVWQVANAVKIPVVGLGGISNATDAIEFIIAGASAIQIGTANFINPNVGNEVVDGIENYLSRHNLTLEELRGSLII